MSVSHVYVCARASERVQVLRHIRVSAALRTRAPVKCSRMVCVLAWLRDRKRETTPFVLCSLLLVRSSTANYSNDARARVVITNFQHEKIKFMLAF